MALHLNYSALEVSGKFEIGPFRLSMEDDGGVIQGAKIAVGYGRRNIESISAQLPFLQVVNYSDRLDYLSAPTYNYLASSAIEQLLALEVPGRARYIRALLMELSRIASHLIYFSKIAGAVEFASIKNHCLREWEKFSDIFEMYSGSRLGFGAICIGGVREDASDGWFFRIEKALSSLDIFLQDLSSVLLDHPFFKERAVGLAAYKKEDILEWNISGPNARCAGVDRDIRSDAPYVAYSDIMKKENIDSSWSGDAWSRSKYRVREIYDSMNLIKNIFRKIPDGNFCIRVGSEVQSDSGLVFQRAESARGEVSILMDCSGGSTPGRVRFFNSSQNLVGTLPGLLKGVRTEDAFLAIHSLDISFSEVDK